MELEQNFNVQGVPYDEKNGFYMPADDFLGVKNRILILGSYDAIYLPWPGGSKTSFQGILM